jgi:hypothetical protein
MVLNFSKAATSINYARVVSNNFQS